MKKRGFSPYDIEGFLKEAGAEDVNEKAVFCLKGELEELTKELVESAQAYANYGGRQSLIKRNDVLLAKTNTGVVLVGVNGHNRLQKAHPRKRVRKHARASGRTPRQRTRTP